MQIRKHWEVISTLHPGHPFYWTPGIKTSSTGKEGSVSGNNWANIACLEEQATLLREGPESHFIFLPITFSFFVSLPFFLIKAMWALRLGDWDGTCVAVRPREEWGEEKYGEMSRTDVTKGITWKKDGKERRRDTDGNVRVPASEEEWYICQTLCVCVCMCDQVSHSLHLPQPNTSHPALSTLRQFTFARLSFHSPLPPPLFTLTVIWQAQGWQTWSWQGKRLSGLAWLGSCWRADSEIGKVRLAEGLMRRVAGVRGLMALRAVPWNGTDSHWEPRGARKQQPELNPVCATSLVTSLQFHRQAWDTSQTPSLRANTYPISHQTAAACCVRYFCLRAAPTISFEPSRLSRCYLTGRNSWQPHHENTVGKVNCQRCEFLSAMTL